MVKDTFYGRNKMAHHEMPDDLDITINLKKGSTIKLITTPTGENPLFKKFRKHAKDHRDTSMNAIYDRMYGSAHKEPTFEMIPVDRPEEEKAEEPNHIQQIKRIKEHLKSGKMVIACNARAIGKNAHTDMMVHIEKLQLKEMMANAGFPLIPPQDSIVLDSFSDLSMAEKAILQLNKTGINAKQAGKDLREAMVKLSNSTCIYDEFLKTENNNVSYSKRQAQKWAPKYSHKIKRRL